MNAAAPACRCKHRYLQNYFLYFQSTHNMNELKIHIENEKSARLIIENGSQDFGVFSRSKDDFIVGFEADPLFGISHSLAEERWFFDVLPDGRRIPRAEIIIDKSAEQWLKDSCCTDFSILNYLPDGEYRLIKTARKTRFMKETLYGNEWADSPGNILTFDGISDKDSMLSGSGDKSLGGQKYYPLIVGGSSNRAPAMNQPLLCVILPDYGIVWDGATGFVFFSFGEDESVMQEEGKIILLMPYSDTFIIDCMNRRNLFNKRIIDDFIKII